MWAFSAMLTCSWVTDDFQRGLLHPLNSHRPAATPQSMYWTGRLMDRVTSRTPGTPVSSPLGLRGRVRLPAPCFDLPRAGAAPPPVEPLSPTSSLAVAMH